MKTIDESKFNRVSAIMSGAFIAVVGPSGAGKDSVMDYARSALESNPNVEFARRIVTRPALAGAEDHCSLTVKEFEQAQKEGAFCLVWQAHGLFYGLPSDIDEKIAAGKIIIANVSRQVLSQLEDKYTDAGAVAGVVNISAQPEILAQRLAARGRESAEDIARRLSREVAITTTKAKLIEIDNSGSLSAAGNAFIHAVNSFE